MAFALNLVLPANYTQQNEWFFKPVNVVSISVTNGSAMGMFVPYSDANTPYNGQAYENQEREMTLTGKYNWKKDDFSGMMVCGMKLRSLNATQLATISFNA